MEIVQEVIQVIFSAALFINALLFIPQAVKIFREKSSKGVSLLTFGGFMLIQLAIILHGIITQDYLLVTGYVLSIIACGAVIILALIYKKG